MYGLLLWWQHWQFISLSFWNVSFPIEAHTSIIGSSGSKHCHGNRKMFNVDLTQLSVFMSDHTPCTHCSLRENDLTDIGAIVLARALERNKSLEELKWVVNWVSSYQEMWRIFSLAVVSFSHVYRILSFNCVSYSASLSDYPVCTLLALILEYSLPQSWIQ